eukprot:CAMPEP_0172375972 /NCGR_PEP_ID=MMETSP1060-20121228/64466_1 /TAXON_ID=37318 /ORGANISM="Pseudo-nitzschia pungens, Strain cf. cingulata" /LENGTH=519 /DNA_ID=CAMNT_0013103313 /DNA_START=101 /DNA_END=1657 /DNA_ORIENTATION=+
MDGEGQGKQGEVEGPIKSLLVSWKLWGDEEEIGGDEKNKNGNRYGSIVDGLSNKSSTCKKSDESSSLTYVNLLSSNKNYRNFWFSYVVNRMGDWMTYMASISLIQEVTNSDSDKNTLISILVLVKLLPNVVSMPIGGVLADSYDRRRVQISLDVLSSGVIWLFLWSYQQKSIPICYLANFVLEVLSGLYLPSNKAIVQQLVGNNPNKTKEENDEELKKGTTLTGMTWSTMAALGSMIGGILVATFGIDGCFIIDSVTYLSSAAFLYYGVQGDYNVAVTATKGKNLKSATKGETEFLLEEQVDSTDKAREVDIKQYGANEDGSNRPSWTMFAQSLKYVFVQEPLVGAYALLKGSAAASFGSADVLNVTFSSRGSEVNPSLTSLKLGTLFGFVGVGCIIGSYFVDVFSNLSRPRSIARLCLSGYFFQAFGLWQMALFPDFFGNTLLSGIVRSIGSSMTWVASTLLIQKYTPPRLLGRVSSIDTSVALSAECLSALGGGLLMDYMGVTPEGLSLILAAVALW